MFDTVGLGISLRVATVKKVGPTYVEIQFADRVGEPTRRVPIPSPYSSQGNGIFIGMSEGDVVVVSRGPYEMWYIVSIIPNSVFNSNTHGAPVSYYQNNYPELESGEISLVGKYGQFIDVLNTGNIALDIGVGAKSANLELSKISNALFSRINQNYTFNEAGRKIEGVIKRDLSTSESSSTTDTTNFLDGEEYDLLLNTIGRSPQNEVQKRSAKVIKSTVRNPALIEKKEITYEYANTFNVLDFNNEVQAIGNISTNGTDIDISKLKTNPSTRQNRRTDILNLNINNFNHLIEKVEGTVVDIYGNILDLNRNVINVPSVNNTKTTGNDINGLRYVYDYLRRSIKYHFEINSRKDLFSPYLNSPEDVNTNYYGNSRFSIDVDAEGLTKINIPASSETGNIPILSRYLTTTDPNDVNNGAFRASNQKDIQIEQFGAPSTTNPTQYSGQTISASDYSPPVVNSYVATAGTAFHDILAIAQSIFTNGTLQNSVSNTASQTNFVPPVSSSINNKILKADDPNFKTNDPNAGGRSLHMNLDGNMELNIGANTVDRNSYTEDMAGGVVSHVGRDINGRSLIQQLDGDVLIQVGGKQINTDPRWPIGSLPNDPNIFRVGRAEIHLVQSSDNSIPPTKILIDENGITFTTNGAFIVNADNGIVLNSGSDVLINGETIYTHGNANPITGEVLSAEQILSRNGRSN